MNIFSLLLIILFIFFGLVVLRGAPYVPSRRKYIYQALTDLYPISKKDVLVDLGSGDGVVLRVAAGLKIKKAIGFELNPILVGLSRVLSLKNKYIYTYFGDYWIMKLPNDVTVVYVFSTDRDINKTANFIQSESNRLNKTIHLISFAFEVKNKKPVKKLPTYYLYRFDSLQSLKAQV